MRDAPIGLRAQARVADAHSAFPYGRLRLPALGARLAGLRDRLLHMVTVRPVGEGSTARQRAERGVSLPTSYALAMAVLVTRAASSRLAWLRSRATGSRTTALRRRSLAERRLVTGFVLSLVVVAAVFADARPLAPLGTADSAGIGEAGAIAGLDGFSGFVADRAPVGAERVDSVDAGGTVDTTSVDEAVATAGNQGAPYLPDGTLLKPVAIDAELPNLLRSDVVTYTVRSGDTLTGIAVRFHVSMSTLWWANKLSSKDSLHVGQELVIPPVSGILWTVEEGDTLESVAAETKGSVDDIKAFNGLTSDTLIIGMQLMVPGGKGAPIPTPKPVAPSRPAGGGYGGHGILRWPVDGGYISQYYWSGHRAIDIAATSGTRVFAAAYGRVAWAGWRNNCGGYQIWIDHGNGMWTTYNHLSAILVGAGTYVGRGQTIGRIGQSGCATGPHLHFAVWRGGAPWTTGAYEVNPLNYI